MPLNKVKNPNIAKNILFGEVLPFSEEHNQRIQTHHQKCI